MASQLDRLGDELGDAGGPVVEASPQWGERFLVRERHVQRVAIMIGEGLGTDIAAARAVGARSVLMLTGVSTQAQLDALPPAERPTAVAADAAALEEALERLSR